MPFKNLLPSEINLEQNFALLSDPPKLRKLGQHPLLRVLKYTWCMLSALIVIGPFTPFSAFLLSGWFVFLLIFFVLQFYGYGWVGVDLRAFHHSSQKSINNELKIKLIEKFEQNKPHIDPKMYAKLSHLIAHNELDDLWWAHLSVAISDVQKTANQQVVEAAKVSSTEMEMLLAQKRKGLAQLSLEADKSRHLSSVVLSTEKIDIDPLA